MADNRSVRQRLALLAVGIGGILSGVAWRVGPTQDLTIVIILVAFVLIVGGVWLALRSRERSSST